MEFEVSFRETLRQLADAQVRLNSMGKVLDANTGKAGKMASATAQAAGQVKSQFETLAKQLDRSGLMTQELSVHLERAQRNAENAFLGMAKANTNATAKLQAFNGALGNLDRLVKDTASKQAYTRWLQKSATLSAEAAGKTQFHITQLDHLSTAEGRAAVAAATLTQERTKSIRESTKAAATAKALSDSHVQAYQRVIQAQKAARESSNAYLAIVNQLTNAEREMAVTGQRVAWGYERLTTRAAELAAQQNAAKAAIDQANRAMIEGAANIERYTGANARAEQAARSLADQEARSAAARKAQLAELRKDIEERSRLREKEQTSYAQQANADAITQQERERARVLKQLRTAIEERHAADTKSSKLVERLTRSEAEYQQRLSRVNVAITARNDLRRAEVAATNTVSSSEAKLTQRIKEQTAEYQRRAKYMQMTNAQLLGISSSHTRLSRDMNINAQAAAMFRAGLGGLNASIGIYTSATVLAASATYAVASAFRTGMSAGMEFTETMARAEAVMMTSSTSVTAAGRSMEAVTMQVRALGASTLYTSTEVAGGLVDLGMAGLSASDAMTSLAPSLNLAAIGSIDMSRAADIATNVMTSFDKTAGQLGNVVDVMATAITNSNTNIEQLANALSYVGPAAQAAGFELEDTTAAIELLSNAGIKASRAGTGLRRFMLNIQNPTAKGAEVLDRFGISIVNAEGQTRSMTDILGQFNHALHNDAITPAERTAAIMDLVGVRAQSAVARMISSFDQFGVLRRQLDEVSGAAEKMRETMEDVLSMDWRQLKSAFQDIQLDTFLKYEDTLRSFTAQARLSLMELQGVNKEMTELVFSPEQIADGKFVTELDILVAKVGEAIDVVKGLGIAFGTWKAASVASTMTGALSKNLWSFGERMETVNNRVKVYERYQRMANAQSVAAGNSVTLYGRAAHIGAQGTNALTRELYLNSQAFSMVGRAASVAMAAMGWAGVVYGLYTAVTTLFSNDTADRIRDHSDNVDAAKVRYEELQEAISKTTEARQLAALNARATEADEEAEGLRRRIELTERALEQMDEQSSAYQRTTDDLFRYNEALAETEKQATEARQAASEVGVNEAQVEGMRERMAMLRESIATTADSIDKYKEASESLADQAAVTRAADGGLDLARAHQVAADKADILTGYLAALKAQVEGLTDATNEAEKAASNHGEAMAAALNAQTMSITAEYEFDQLSDFEKMKQMEAERNVILASSIRLSEEGIALNEEGVDVMLRWTDQALKANEASLEFSQSVQETWQKVGEKQAEIEAAQRNEIDTLESLRLKMNEVQAARIAMYAMSAVTGEAVDPEKVLGLQGELLDLQNRMNTLNNKGTKGSRSGGRSANRELEQMLRTFQQLRDEYDPVTAATLEYNKQLGEMDKLLKLGKISTDDHAAAKAHLTNEYKKSINPLTEIRDILDPIGKLTEEYQDKVEALNAAVALGTITWLEAAEAQMIYAAELGEGKDAIDPYAKRTKELLDQYGDVDDIVKTQKAISDLNERLRDDSLPDDIRRNLVRARESAEAELQELVYQSDDAAQEIRRSWDQGMEGIDTAFVDGIEGMLNKSENLFDNFADAMIDGIKRMLAEMAYQAYLKPIVVQMTTAIGGQLGIPGVGGGQLGIPGVGGGAGGFDLSSMGSLGKTVSGWLGAGGAAAGTAPIGYASGFGAQAATGTYTGWAGSAAAGAANPGMFASMGGLSGIAGGLGAGYAGMQLGNQLAPDAKHGDIAGGLGAVGGFMLGGPLGSAIGGAIGASISKGLFGGSWQTKDGGLQLGVSAGDTFGNQYERQRKSGGLFSGSSYRTKTSDLDSEFEAALSQTYQAQELALRASLDTLGQQSSALNSFSDGLEKISTKGKSDEEVEQAVQDWLQGVVNNAAKSVVDPAEYALAGETTVATLNRLATALTGVNPILEQLHGNAYVASLAGGDAAASLLTLSGGMEQFAQRAEFYYQNFYSETERQEAVMTQAAQAMGAFTARTGEIVTTTDQLRALVDGIDRNSEAGRELYAAAMQLAPALVEVENGLERVKNRFADMLSEAESALGSAEDQARSAWDAFEDQSFKQQITLLENVGDSQAALALQRERELQGIDPLLHETQRFIWAMEDESDAKQNATQAAQNYRREIERVRNELSNTLGNISGWVDQQNATGGTPGMNLAEAQDQLARQLVLAESSDRSALQSITQYADRVLQANEAYNASSPAGQSIRDDVLGALENLPDLVSAEEYIADEIKQALREQTQGISSQLSDVLRGDNPSNIAGNLAGYFTTLAGGIDGVLTREQLAIVMSGKATDAELNAIMRAVDINGDGVMNGLESVIIAGMPTDAVLGTVLRNKMNELDKNQLTHAQVRSALSPIASDAEIDRLIREVDVNGDGIISKQELTAGRIGGLAAGIAKGLNPAFDMLDSNLDGKLTFAELSAGLNGMATDAQLKVMMASMDVNGDGIISGLESVIIKSMPHDATLANVLRTQMQATRTKQLTHAQVRNALSPIATDAEISRLIREVDVNGDGIISKQELTASRVGGLAAGIAKSLNPAFNRLDKNLDNLIDYGEFSNAFKGMASDSELRRIFNKLDADGSGTISRLEALNRSSDGTEDNTKTLEERARDQLGSLNGLVSEMSRTTDQFIGLSSTMVSLKDSINALGVAQAEVARIERERRKAEKAERERIERERKAEIAAQRSSMESRLKSLKKQQGSYQSTIDFNQAANARGEGGLHEFYRTHSNVRKGSSSLEDLLSGSYNYTYRPGLGTSKKVSGFLGEYNDAMQNIDSVGREIERLMESLNSMPKFADGGVFTNSIVSRPTPFDMGLMGEVGPEAIMPLSRGPGGDLGVRVHGGGNRRDDERLIQELRESNAQLRKAVTLLQTGFKDLASTSKSSEGHLKSMKRAAKMAEMVR